MIAAGAHASHGEGAGAALPMLLACLLGAAYLVLAVRRSRDRPRVEPLAHRAPS